MANYYIKLYHEILDDPKMGRLPDHLFRRTIEVFLLAGDYDQNGYLPPVEDMAWKLHIPENDIIGLTADLEAIERLTKTIDKPGIVHQDSDGRWIVTNFEKRQERVTDVERKRYQRQRDRINNPVVTKRDNIVTENVTNGVRELELDIELNKELDTNVTANYPNIFTLYENTIGIISPTIRDELLQAEKDFPTDWIEDAFRETARQNKHNWKYTAAILRSWKDNGSKRTGTKAENTPAIDPRSLASEVYE